MSSDRAGAVAEQHRVPTDRPGRLDGDDLRLAADLRIATGRLARRLRRVGNQDVPPLQYSVLATLARIEPAMLADLATREGVSVPTMSRVVSALVQRDLVVRQADAADARRIRLTLSTEGLRLLRQVAHDSDRALSDRLRRLPAEERMRLVAAIPILELMLVGD